MRYAHTDDYLLQKLLNHSEVSQTSWYGGIACREWKRANRGGYGRLWTGLKLEDTHIVSYRVNKGPIPEGHEVLHHCDNPACWEPSHLWTGTHADNMRDSAAKGRTGGWRLKGIKRGPSQQRGTKHKLSKLTPAIVRELHKQKKRKDDGFRVRGTELAAKLGISPSLVYGVWAGRNWAWLL